MALSCQRCGLTTSGPQAFLLTCRGCRKTWHHRCHMPPIEDQELIQLVRATRSGDKNNDLSTWTCRRCKKCASETPSAVSSREPTVSLTNGSREDSKGLTSTSASTPCITDTDSLVDGRLKQESRTYRVDSRPANDCERNKTGDRRALTEVVPEKRTLSAKRTKPSVAHVKPQPGPTQPGYRDVRVTPHEKKIVPQRSSTPTHSHSVKAARKLPPESATSAEDDNEMQVDSSPLSALRAISRASQSTPSIDSGSVSDVPSKVHAVSSSDDMEREVTPVSGAAIQPPVNQVAADEMDDDPEDLYGPPVERRIIRILPSLAEELREQQRRVAAEKEKRRAPLAPDWILARHVNDPLWKNIPTGGRKRQKPIARKLGDDGLNLKELMSCFTVLNWVREHKV